MFKVGKAYERLIELFHEINANSDVMHAMWG
jgi:hypothetical protein